MGEALPKEFGRYRLVERLAVGGMAEIYRATMSGAHDFHKVVVIKRILPHLAADAEFVSMFVDEAKLTAQLMHPKIVQVFELGTMEARPFIAMEYVDGVDLLTMLRHFAEQDRRIPAAVAVHILHEVLDALDYAHGAKDDDGRPLGIVHRDVSPGNILISRRGDVKLTDFGIAHAAATQDQTETGLLKGKYSYMAPEQITGTGGDARSDLFTCGVVLAELLIGRPLFGGKSELDVLFMVREVKLDRLHQHGRGIHQQLRWILERALRREPGQRFRSAREFRDALSDWLFDQRRRVQAREVAELVEEVQEARARRAPEPALDAVPAPVETGEPSSAYAEIDTRAPAPDGADDAEDLGLEEAADDLLIEEEPGPEPGDPLELGELDLGPAGGRAAAAGGAADREGELGSRQTALRLLYELAARRETGLLELELGAIAKRAYFDQGRPRQVESNVASERLGEVMVAQGLLADGELSMALAIKPQLGGKLGDTLLALGLIDRRGMRRALRVAHRARLVDVCTWQRGSFRWYGGRRGPTESDTAELDPYEILGAGAMALERDFVEGWAQWCLDNAPAPLQNDAVRFEDFRLGPRPREIHGLLDGRRTVRDLWQLLPSRQVRLDAMRVLFLLIQADYAKFT